MFHVRRASYLERTADREGAAEERTRAAADTAVEHTAVDDFLEGEAAYRGRDYQRAIPAFRRVLTHQPDHFWGQYLLAICHLKEHRPAEAQAALTACQVMRPGFVWTHLLKGFAEGEMREFDLAETDFARASELGLDDAARYVMLVNRGVMRIRRGHHEAAVEDLLAAIALKPDAFQAYINLAQAYQDLHRFDRALEAIDRALVQSPGQAVLHRACAQVHLRRSHDREALDDLGRAIALSPPEDPGLVGDHLDRALIFQRAGRHAEALAECDRALVLQPAQPDVHRVRGAVLVTLNRLDEAIRSFDVCLSRGTPSTTLYEARGLALANRGSYERAIADYTLALGARPADAATLYSHRGWAYLFSGAAGPAVRDFDEALRRDPSEGRALSGRALANVQQRKVREAVADAGAVARTHARDPRLLYSAARVYCQAAACLESEPTRSQGDWRAAGRYRAEAMALLARSMSRMPRAEGVTFWAQVVRTDTALEPIRKAKAFLELDAEYAATARRDAPGRASPDGVSPR